jgi:hypothetical protein
MAKLWEGQDFTGFEGWTFKYCPKDGFYYAYPSGSSAIVRVVIAPTAKELRDRLSDIMGDSS